MRPRITEYTGDIRDPAAVARAIEGAEVVVHTAAALPLYSKEDIYTTDIVGTRNVIEAAYKAGVDRFVHISSTAVYGIPDHHLEDDCLGAGPTAKPRSRRSAFARSTAPKVCMSASFG
jgi:nucleoside-diphosphate-sugar epimerase